MALPLGLFIGFASYSFVRVRQLFDALPYPAWARGLVLGSLVGLAGLFAPDTLTWGEFQIEILASFRMPLSTYASTGLALAKFCTTIMTIASGCTHEPRHPSSPSTVSLHRLPACRSAVAHTSTAPHTIAHSLIAHSPRHLIPCARPLHLIRDWGWHLYL
jgi:hypothetical protein